MMPTKYLLTEKSTVLIVDAVYPIVAWSTQCCAVGKFKATVGIGCPRGDVMGAQLAPRLGRKTTSLTTINVALEHSSAPLCDIGFFVSRPSFGCAAARPTRVVLSAHPSAAASVWCKVAAHNELATLPRAKPASPCNTRWAPMVSTAIFASDVRHG